MSVHLTPVALDWYSQGEGLERERCLFSWIIDTRKHKLLIKAKKSSVASDINRLVFGELWIVD